MLIEHRQYLAILDEIDYLRKDSDLLRQQNLLLTQQLHKQKQHRLLLQDQHSQTLQLLNQLHSQSLLQHSDTTTNIINTITQCNDSTKTFLENKFQTLQNATTNQHRENQLKLAKNKLDLYELQDFANKIRTIHKETLPQTNSQTKTSLSALLKWIKSIALLACAQQKLGLTVSSSTSNIKKQGLKRTSKVKENSECLSGLRQSKLKENTDILNGLDSKSKIAVSEQQKSKNSL